MSKSLKLSSSKSLINRYLILKEGHPKLDLDWCSQAEDVQNLRLALMGAPKDKIYYLGDGGTTLRFFAAYLSTFQGEWTLTCSKSLLRRPQKELISSLKTLGVDLVQIDESSLFLKSEGWKRKEISIDLKESTQVLTGLALAAISKKCGLKVKIKEIGSNSDYFEMTKKFVTSLGFTIFQERDLVTVPEGQSTKVPSFKKLEADWSSAAFLMVLAALKGELHIDGLSDESLQPDSVIFDFLKNLGADSYSQNGIKKGQTPYGAFEINIQKCPDLFPVLSVLACFCKGKSKIFGAPQLKNKETNRIVKMVKLLELCGYRTEALEGGIVVQGEGMRILENNQFEFDVSKDHRLYMATEILGSMGYKIRTLGKNSIRKSFAEYEDLKRTSLKCFF